MRRFHTLILGLKGIFMNTSHLATAMLVCAIALTLSACNRSGETIGQKIDGAATQTKEAAADAASQASASMEKTLEKTAEVVKEDSAKASNAFGDAAITTSIVASLTKDPDLSALKIDVDTKADKVSMHGSAPSTQARSRAASIAQSVKGVISVDNQLTIKEKS
jgi:hyperosmotically inducible periplasmic protein